MESLHQHVAVEAPLVSDGLREEICGRKQGDQRARGFGGRRLSEDLLSKCYRAYRICKSTKNYRRGIVPTG